MQGTFCKAENAAFSKVRITNQYANSEGDPFFRAIMGKNQQRGGGCSMTQTTYSWIQNDRHHKTFVRMFISFMCLILGLMSVSTFFLYKQFSDAAVEEIRTNTEQLLAERTESLAYLMNWTADYALKAALSGEMMSYALAEAPGIAQDVEIWLKLKQLKNNHPFIHSIYLVNDTAEKVVDTETGVFGLDEFYDQDVLTQIRTQIGDGSDRQIMIRRMSGEHNSIRFTGNYFTSVQLLLRNGSISALVMNLDVSAIHNYLIHSLKDSEEYIQIIDEAGRIVSSSQPDDFLKTASLPAGLNGTSEGGSWIERNGNRLNVYTNFTFTGAGNWKAVHAIPLDTVFLKVNRLRTVTFVSSAILLAVALVTAWLVSRHIYSPIGKLIGDVKRSVRSADVGADPSDSPDELAFLSRTFNDLDSRWRRSSEVAKDHFLCDLLEREPALSGQKLGEAFREHRLAVPAASLALIVMRLDRKTDIEGRYGAKDVRLMLYAVRNIAMEILSRLGGVDAVELRNDHVALLCESEEGTMDRFVAAVKDIQSNVNQYLHLTMTAVVSPYIETAQELHSEYIACLRESNNRFKLGVGHLFIRHSAEGAETAEDFQYPDNVERHLLNELKLGHEEAVRGQFHKFMNAVMTGGYADIRISLLRLLLSIDKTIQLMKLEFSTPVHGIFPDSDGRTADWETRDDFEASMLELFDRLFAAMRQQSSTNNTQQLIDQLQTIVKENLFDPNLSTKLVAGEVGLSVVYIRQLFKDHTGQSLSDYIADQRIERVKEQLTHTSRSIDEIVLETGFSAINSFYKIFKRKTGITPAQYRKNYS